jgi:hypothetical protein
VGPSCWGHTRQEMLQTDRGDHYPSLPWEVLFLGMWILQQLYSLSKTSFEHTEAGALCISCMPPQVPWRGEWSEAAANIQHGTLRVRPGTVWVNPPSCAPASLTFRPFPRSWPSSPSPRSPKRSNWGPSPAAVAQSIRTLAKRTKAGFRKADLRPEVHLCLES